MSEKRSEASARHDRTLAFASRTVSEPQPVTAVRYAKLVRDFSCLPDGRGANHAPLASFLGKFLSYGSSSFELARDAEHFALSYSFCQKNDANSAQGSLKWTLTNAVEYESCFDFESKMDSESSKSISRILFLRGFPSAEWLGVVAARYKIDSEFFARFLHFKPAKDAVVNYSLPAIPAAAWTMIGLPVVSTGERRHGFIKQAEIDEMRREARSKLQKHHDRRRGNGGIAVASSVVRDLAILDHSSFAIEQRIWVCLQPQSTHDAHGTRWILVVWTDAGNSSSFKSIQDLDILPSAFQTEATSLAPVIDYKPNTGLVYQKFLPQGQISCVKGVEAGSQLCHGYGRTLYEDVMATDGFYALTEIFNMATASLNQYLNLIEDKLAGFTDDEHYDDFSMLSNLRYTKDILYRQQRQIEHVNAWLKLHMLQGSDGWRTTWEQDPRATRAAESVVHRYDYLQTRVRTLQAQCQDAISNLVNNINLKEVKNSIDQTKRMSKLTFLAFIFAPLSFTTGFFSMNIGLNNLTLTAWFVTTIVLMALTLFFWMFDVLGWLRIFRDKARNATEKALFS